MHKSSARGVGLMARPTALLLAAPPRMNAPRGVPA